MLGCAIDVNYHTQLPLRKVIYGLLYYMFACYTCGHTHHSLRVEVRGQPREVCSFLFIFTWVLEIEVKLSRLQDKVLQLHHIVLRILYIYFQRSQQLCKIWSISIVPILQIEKKT